MIFLVPPALIISLTLFLSNFSIPSWMAIGLVVGLIILLMGLVLFLLTRIGAEEARVRAEGTPGEGRILRIDSTGTSLNDSPELAITIEVCGQEDIVLTTRTFIPFYVVPQIQPGAIVPIFVLDESFALDIEAMKSAPATST